MSSVVRNSGGKGSTFCIDLSIDGRSRLDLNLSRATRISTASPLIIVLSLVDRIRTRRSEPSKRQRPLQEFKTSLNANPANHSPSGRSESKDSALDSVDPGPLADDHTANSRSAAAARQSEWLHFDPSELLVELQHEQPYLPPEIPTLLDHGLVAGDRNSHTLNCG